MWRFTNRFAARGHREAYSAPPTTTASCSSIRLTLLGATRSTWRQRVRGADRPHVGPQRPRWLAHRRRHRCCRRDAGVARGRRRPRPSPRRLPCGVGTRGGCMTLSWAVSVVAMPESRAHPPYPQLLALAGFAETAAGDGAAGTRRYYARRSRSPTRSASTTGGKCRAIGDDWELRIALVLVAFALHSTGDLTAATGCADESLVLARRLGSRHAPTPTIGADPDRPGRLGRQAAHSRRPARGCR